MEGERPIYDLNSCLTAEDDVAFIIIREVYCSERALDLSQSGLGRIWYENLCIKSFALRSALNATATCYIYTTQAQKDVQGGPYGERGSADNASLMAERELYVPHLFLYHHRSRLREYASKHSDALSHIKALLAYASYKYGDAYEEADALFSNGFVTRRHLKKLFAPNELVFTYTNGQPSAYAMQEWPETSVDKCFRLHCWSWRSDGAVFARKKCILDLHLPQLEDEEIEIKLLSVVPLTYIAPEIYSHLELRGRKHWSLRSQSYVSYKGWNVSHDQFYASPIILL